MISNKKQAAEFEKKHKDLFDIAANKHRIALEYFQATNYRSVVALRVGTTLEERLITGWLKKNNEGNAGKQITFGTIVRIILLRLGVIQDEHLAVMHLNKFKMDFLDYIDYDFKKIEELEIGGKTILPFEENPSFYSQYAKEPAYKNLVANLDPFLKDLWTEYFNKKTKSGTYLLKQEMMKMGIYPEAYFTAVIKNSTKKRHIDESLDYKQGEKKIRTVREKSDNDMISFGITLSGIDAQKMNSFKNLLAERKISVADVVRFELVKQNVVDQSEFERLSRTTNKLSDKIVDLIKKELNTLQLVNDLNDVLRSHLTSVEELKNKLASVASSYPQDRLSDEINAAVGLDLTLTQLMNELTTILGKYPQGYTAEQPHYIYTVNLRKRVADIIVKQIDLMELKSSETKNAKTFFLKLIKRGGWNIPIQ